MIAPVFALPAPSPSKHDDSSVIKQTQLLLQNAPEKLESRITYFSEKFLGIKYVFRSFGEGPSGDIQTAPLYHFNSFDCVNYIELVLALSFSKNISELNNYILKIRYENQMVNFKSRNHISETDWIPSNTKNGFLKDITRTVAKENTATLTSVIDRKSWMQKLQPAQLQPSKILESEILKKLKELSRYETQKIFSLDYIPKKYLLENLNLVENIPNGTIVHFLATPYQSDTILYGTQLFVYHAGFLIKKDKTNVFRSASAQKAFRKVVDFDFQAYIQEANKNDNFLGIHLLQPLPQSSIAKSRIK